MQQVLFLGIDGGGTGCRARIRDADGTLLGEGSAGSANTRLGLPRVFAEIRTACEQALAAAGLESVAIHRLHAGLGLAGLALRSERAALADYPHPFASMIAENDAYTACLGAHQGGDGAILILGTGSCGCGIVGEHSFSIGGWGFQLGDQGSGAALGLAAVREVLLAHERVIDATPLSRTIMARFDDSPEQAVLWSDQAVPRDYAELVPLIFEYAERSDPLALRLIRQTAAAATQLTQALLDRGAPRVAWLGGLANRLQNYAPLELRERLVEPAGDALDGAIVMARRHFRGSAGTGSQPTTMDSD